MKTSLIVGTLLLGMSSQAFSMGHPHNMFAAHKQMRARALSMQPRTKTAANTCWQSVTQTKHTSLSQHILTVLTSFRPARSY